jgi:hypothetical protein
MPLERHIDDLTACDGIKFWMSDGERPVLCRVSHEALRDLANRVHFDGTYEKSSTLLPASRDNACIRIASEESQAEQVMRSGSRRGSAHQDL